MGERMTETEATSGDQTVDYSLQLRDASEKSLVEQLLKSE